MSVGEVCTREAVTVLSCAALDEVAAIMRDRHVGAVVVTKAPLDAPVVVGIVTDRDIVRAQLKRAESLSRMRADEVMTRDPLILNEQQSIAEAISQLQVRGVRRAPVIDASGLLVGVVSTDDLLARVSEELLGLAQLVTRQASRESA